MRTIAIALIRRRRATGIALALLVSALVVAFGANTWYQNTLYISTENASITGALVQVTSPNPGRVLEVAKEVGDVIQRGESLATIDLPFSTSLPLGGARTTYLDAQDRLLKVPSPAEGVVVSRNANIGDTVTTSQALFTIIDTRNLWVVANIEETKIALVHPGQEVDVYVDTLQQTFRGVVESITPASTSTFSLLPAQNVAGNYTKVVQLVPVKIEVQYGHALLIVGTSASVRIHLR